MNMIRVLLVDDEAELGNKLKTILEERWDCHTVTLAYSGESALAFLKEDDFDVLVTDIRMPQMTGIELLKKAREIRKDLETIVISGHGDFEHAIEAMKLGANNYLTKPVPVDALHFAIIKAWEKQKARLDLRESEEKYRFLFEAVPIGIGIADLDGNILKYNKYLSEMMGYPSDEMAKTNVRGTYCDLDERVAMLEELRENGRVNDWEIRLKRKNASVLDALLNVEPIELRGRRMLLTSIRDVTLANIAKKNMVRRLRMEELISAVSTRFIYVETEELDSEIRRFLKRIGEFTESDRAYVTLFGDDGKTVEVGYEWCAESVKPGFARIKGMSVDAFPWVAKKLRDYEAVRCAKVSGLDQEAAREKAFFEALSVRSFVVLPMVINNRLGGFMGISSHTIEKTLSDEDTQMLSVLANIFANVIERKSGELALKQATKTAEDANRAKSEFLAKMSHELRTPLNGILGYTQILKRAGGLTEKQEDAISIIHQSGEHLLMMINDILDLSKIEAGEMNLVVSDFHLPGFLKNIIDISTVKANEKQIGFHYIPPPKMPAFVRGDEKCLRQVLLNLLSNAIKYTEKGHVSFSVAHYDGCFLFNVSDTGIGVPKEKLEEIFLPFHQVAGNYLQADGTGMGLAISRELVKMMGSELSVQSVLGKGSAFRFKLNLPPIHYETKKDVKPVRSRIIGYEGDRKKVLIVDDLADNRTLFKNMLLSVGFEPLEAIDGYDALRKAAEFQPDFVLMDLVMPNMDGYEATRRLRREMADMKPVIIVVSANVIESARKLSAECGCDDFITKPVDFDELLNKMATHLKLRLVLETNGRTAESDLTEIKEPIKPPPKTEIGKLHEMAKIGDLDGIRECAEYLAPEYTAFCEYLTSLTRNFQTRQIKEFLGRYLEN